MSKFLIFFAFMSINTFGASTYNCSYKDDSFEINVHVGRYNAEVSLYLDKNIKLELVTFPKKDPRSKSSSMNFSKKLKIDQIQREISVSMSHSSQSVYFVDFNIESEEVLFDTRIPCRPN